MVTSTRPVVYPPSQPHIHPRVHLRICLCIFLIHLPIHHHPFLPTHPYIYPPICPPFVHPSAYLLTHPTHMYLPIHPSIHLPPPLSFCSFTYFSQLLTPYPSSHSTFLPIYLPVLVSPSIYLFSTQPSTTYLSSGPSTHHFSVPTTYPSVFLYICQLTHCLIQPSHGPGMWPSTLERTD